VYADVYAEGFRGVGQALDWGFFVSILYFLFCRKFEIKLKFREERKKERKKRAGRNGRKGVVL
jgi:hypothetical protein